MEEPFLGEISMVAFNFEPRGWAFCDGRIMSISQNSALFALLGTTYGGDGRVTFALPDLRGRFPIGMGQGLGLSAKTLGERSGVEKINLLTTQMPTHTHLATTSSVNATIPISDDAANSSASSNSVLGIKGFDKTSNNLVELYSNTGHFSKGHELSISTSIPATTVQPSGGGQPINITPPYLCINFIIAITGIFPSRQ